MAGSCKLVSHHATFHLQVPNIGPQLLDEMSILSKGLPRDHLLGEYLVYFGQRLNFVYF